MASTSSHGQAVYAHSRLVAIAGREEELAVAISAVTNGTRQEAGSLQIEPFRSNDQPALFFIVGSFEGKEAVEFHRNQQYVADFLAKVAILTVESSVSLCSIADRPTG